MLTFNLLLREAGIELTSTRLIRHVTGALDIYSGWRNGDADFELYQSTQRWKYRFPVGGHLASFVVTPAAETLFVGLYEVRGLRRAGPDEPAALGVRVTEGDAVHELYLSDSLAPYIGRLVIDWGPSAITYIQHAHRQDKSILEVRKDVPDPPFPGFSSFRCKIGDLPKVPPNWQSALSSSRGIYLLTSPDGEHYVGGAYGFGGLWSRIIGYAYGDQGNQGLVGKHLADFDVCILDTVSNSATDDHITRIESLWKDKLGSRTFGLNRN